MKSTIYIFKTLTTILALMFIFSGGLSAQTFGEWELVNPDYYPEHMRSVSFADNDNVWAVGDNSLLLHSPDGGFSWSFQGTGLKTDFTDIHFVDSQNAWIVGDDGLILHSNNGGAQWSIQNSGTDRDLRGVFFLDENTGWAVGRTSTILKTSDGGINWEQQNASSSGSTFDNVQFLNENFGMVVGSKGTQQQVYIMTTDGGETWEESIFGSPNVFYDLHIFDEDNTIISARNGRTFRTSDGGENWTWSTVASTSSSMRSIRFIDENKGWIVGTIDADGNTPVLFTEDAGISWTNISGESRGNYYSVDAINDGHFVGVGLSGLISTTTDNGTTVQNLPEEPRRDLFSIAFTDADNGWISGTGGTLLNTTNGGESWEVVKSTDQDRFGDIFFQDTMSGWIAGSNGQIRKTTDGGENWEVIETEASANVLSITFLDSSNGWAVGSSGSVLKTEDAGESWTLVDVGVTSPLYSVEFIDENTGFIAGGGFTSGIILKTTDSGETWEEVRTLNRAIFDLHFIDDSVGWAVAGGGIILKTENGGSDWFGIPNNASETLNSVFFADPDNGWAVGSDGETAYTTDGGATWEALDGANGVTLRDVYVDASNRVWTVGNNGLIMKFNQTDAPAAVGLLFPANQSVDVPVDTQFIWGASFGSSSYEFQIATDQSFSSIVIDEPELSTTSIALQEDLSSEETYYWRVKASSFGVASEWSDVYMFTTEFATSIQDGANVPHEFSLSPSYPNPFNPTTQIRYGLADASHVTLEVYNMIGQRVATLVNEQQTAGYHTVSFDGSRLSSGVYIYRILAGNFTATRKMTLVK
ncbi:MAG: T9SS type A sorting domain-containing protein [Balneolia bacterium]|nr:T9SS type A sorting domain-containing protein [Balneolia bacterium]